MDTAYNNRVVRLRVFVFFFFQAEDGIRDLVRSRGLGDVYKRQRRRLGAARCADGRRCVPAVPVPVPREVGAVGPAACLLYTSDAADERSSVDLGGRRIIKKKNSVATIRCYSHNRERTGHHMCGIEVSTHR